MSLSIHSAAQTNQIGLARALLAENGPAIANARDVDERTPLHWAASSGSLEIARMLIDNKASTDAADNSGWTPLHIACSAGQDEVVLELVGAGADVNSKNDKGLTPLCVQLAFLGKAFSDLLQVITQHRKLDSR
ncbi:ankyrin [Cylindrobasidium torrendii FP15055 ss-10]|uniref:Ankyrin n=1 Tax=Cylindrobasidium torrendii FP15055 ss-10 TaxID=1314674 RepID=A0A0D7B469_9AGAR|nr:ankyrin [Cylindrobasidium torrendii FP15055 ss-10]